MKMFHSLMFPCLKFEGKEKIGRQIFGVLIGITNIDKGFGEDFRTSLITPGIKLLALAYQARKNRVASNDNKKNKYV